MIPYVTEGVDVHADLPARPVVRFRAERADELVGLATPREEQHARLRRLGFDVDGEQVTVPTWRARDVTREIDVVEEVARVVLDRVPHTMPLRRAVAGHLSEDQRLRRLVEDVLVGEVWVGSGQSNMAGGAAGYVKGDEVLAKLVEGTYPKLRLPTQPRRRS